MKIITRYILKEIGPNYLIGLGFLSVILFVVQVFQTVKLIVENNIPINKSVIMLVYYLPLILQFTIPIAVVVGTLLAIGRLSSDSEIIAMRACGISLLKIFFPTLWFGIFMTLSTILFYEFVLPEAATQYAEAKIQIYQINPTAELSAKLAFDTIDNIRITVDSVDDSSNELINIRINYINENKMIFARRGILLSKDYEKNAFPLILFNSTMQPANLKHPSADKRFDEQFNIKQIIFIPDRPTDTPIPRGNDLWSLSEFFRSLDEREFEMALYNIRDYNAMQKLEIDYQERKTELSEFLKNLNSSNSQVKSEDIKKEELEKKIQVKKAQVLVRQKASQIERRNSPEGRVAVNNDKYLFHRKLAFSFSALAFALLGAPLGIFSKRAGKSLGLGVSIIIIVLFFAMVFLGNFLMRKEWMSSIIASWYPNVVLYFLGAYYIIKRLRGK